MGAEKKRLAPSCGNLCREGRWIWGWFELRTLERDKVDFDTDNYVITANETLTKDVLKFYGIRG